MANISVSLPSDGQTIDASDYGTPINTIVNDYNGNIDNSNIAAAAAIAGTKLADSAITTAKIADANVTNAKLATSAGEIGAAWAAWTPTMTADGGSPAIGNGTLNAKYLQIGKTIHFKISLTFGSTTSFGTGAVYLSPPISNATDFNTNSPVGTAFMRDNSTTNKLAGVIVLNSGKLGFYSNMSLTALAATGAASPWTWATSDTLYASGTYEAA